MAGKQPPARPGRNVARGIVIRPAFEPPRRPVLAAFIWGGKIRPVPAIPYGRRSA
ncbi:MAG: hypothetical protein L0271_17410 [Gemmatimonadetes bacterium]|nr:hypothetical protein [Gemmatimonadota bacterium]